MATAASYDSTLRYGTQTPFNDQLTFHWEGGEWRVDATHNSIITAGNGGSAAAKTLFTIYYDSGRKRYDLEQELKPHEQMWVDVGKLIRDQVPDKNGLLLPSDLMMGSYELQDLTDRGVGNLYEGKVIVDKTYGHVAYGCATCCGYNASPWMYYDPIGVGIDYGSTQDVWGRNNCTSQDTSVLEYILDSSWDTGNHAIATASNAVITGVAVGSTTNSATGTLTIGNINSLRCPQEPTNPSGPVNVTPTITGGNIVWWFNGQNPDSTDYPISVTLTSSGGSSTSWAVTQQDSKVSLSTATGATTTVTSTGSHFSASSGDISITATANGVPSSPFAMTAKTPWKLVLSSTNTYCYASPQTYGTEISYNVQDNLSVTMSSDIYWNESVGTATCSNGSNWCGGQISTSGGDSNPLKDILAPPNLNVSPAPVPTPTCNGQGTGTTLYRSIPQTIYVGGSNTGQGVQAQQDSLAYYIDHGQHNNIQSPPQPPQ
jgi:hypothetical protein